MIFENQQINTDSLPKVSDLIFLKVEPKYVTVSMIASIVFWGFLFLAAFILKLYVFEERKGEGIIGGNFEYVLILIGALAIISTYLSIQGAKVKSYALRQNDILFRTGYIWYKEIAVPFNRIQHSEVVQGPIDRLFDLSTLKIYTAGGSQSDLKIPGLKPQKANQLKEIVTLKVGQNEEE